MLSIDQNCTSLWDAIPKLHALAAAGVTTTHCIEDIDVAFTQMGAKDENAPPRLAMERFHRSGGQDWGAALFFSLFLSPNATEIRRWEKYIGLQTAALARKLGQSVDELYDSFSPGGTWQLIGPSFVGGKDRHRLIGDITIRQSADSIRQLIEIAHRDTIATFPDTECVARGNEWFAAEQAFVDDAVGRLGDDGQLVDLYRMWIARHVGDKVAIDSTSHLMAVEKIANDELFSGFIADYPTMASAYNKSLAQADVGLEGLDSDEGQLPFFATYRHDGKLVRSEMFLRDGEIVVADKIFPASDGAAAIATRLANGGIIAIAGKAATLTLQVRLGRYGDCLALPYNGSAYMPATFVLEENLRRAGLLSTRPKDVYRVRFHLLDRMSQIDATIRLKPHLARSLGCDEIQTKDFAARWRSAAAQASARLNDLATSTETGRWRSLYCPAESAELQSLDARRRELAGVAPKGAEIQNLSRRTKELEQIIANRLLQQVSDDWHTSQLDYWDSRGAIIPWCIAMGGEKFYNYVIANAKIYPEQPAQHPGGPK